MIRNYRQLKPEEPAPDNEEHRFDGRPKVYDPEGDDRLLKALVKHHMPGTGELDIHSTQGILE